MKIEEVYEKVDFVFFEVGKVIVGKENVLKMILVIIFVDGYVFIEDLFGLVKILMVKSFVGVFGFDFKCVQFIFDLLFSDIIGVSVFNQKIFEFEFRKGLVFINIFFVDEVNRFLLKIQFVFFEVMQERQVIVEGKIYLFLRFFVVIVIQNLIEQEGIYLFLEVQFDRFLVRFYVGYLMKEEEFEILWRRIGRKSDEVSVFLVVMVEEVFEMQCVVEDVYVSDLVLEYIVDIVEVMRRDKKDVEVGVFLRGSFVFFKFVRVYVVIEGRDYVIFDDVKVVVILVLSYRFIFKRELWYMKVS